MAFLDRGLAGIDKFDTSRAGFDRNHRSLTLRADVGSGALAAAIDFAGHAGARVIRIRKVSHRTAITAGTCISGLAGLA